MTDRKTARARLVEVARQVLDQTSLAFTLRDHSGQVLEIDDRIGQRLGTSPEDITGRAVAAHTQVLDERRRQIPLVQHPAQIARTSGRPQFSQVLGLRRPDGSEAWMIGDFIPVDAGKDGYSVLSVLTDVTDIQVARFEAEARADAVDIITEVALRLAGRRLTAVEAVETLREPLLQLLPSTQLGISLHLPQEIRFYAIHQLDGMVPSPPSIPRSAMERHGHAHVRIENDLGPADVFGPRVIGADPVPARSGCVVPVLDADGTRLGSIAAYSQSKDFFTPPRVEGLERVGRLLGRALILLEA